MKRLVLLFLLAAGCQAKAKAISDGKQLFTWYNCSGCHANGGGGMGPALMDSVWIYGSEPEQIFTTIIEGRPNGMPAFRGKLSEGDAWKLVAYVRSLAALEDRTTSPSRADSLAVHPPETRLPRQTPVGGKP
jgi:cytochrome c oxidase cbb3-type subunit III